MAVNDATVIITAGPVDEPNGFVPPVRLDRLEVGERRARGQVHQVVLQEGGQ